MKHFLKKIVLFLTRPQELMCCISMIAKCNEAGISAEIFTIQELVEQSEEASEQVLYISDDAECIRKLSEAGCATLAYLHAGNRHMTFQGSRYAMENPQELTPEYLEQVFRRERKLPWDILQTERLLLRETTIEDVDAFWDMYQEPELTKYTEKLYPTLEEEKAYIRDYIQNMYYFYEFGVWTVICKESGRTIGRAGFSLREGREEPELGYVIAKDCQGRGYAAEICTAILQYAKECMEISTVGAVVHKDNLPSIGLLKKLGFLYAEEQSQDMEYYTKEL